MYRATVCAPLLACATALVSACGDPPPTLGDLASRRGLLVGAAVQSQWLATEPDYAAAAAAEFHSLTPENAFKWMATEPSHGTFTWDEADAVADFAVAHHRTLRGHTLVWANSYSAQLFAILPDYVAQAPDAATMQGYLDEHIAAVVTRYADVTDRWDVVNEPLSTADATVDANVLTDTLGEAWMVRAFEQAHALDPEARLYVNEALIDGPGPRHDALMALVARLRAAGAPIHGVGLQSHFLFGAPPSADLESVMRDWGSVGLEVAITELDLPALDGDLDVQASAYRSVFESCLAVDACSEITLWGITDRHTWLDGFLGRPARPLLFDADMQRKPAYDAVAAALRGR